ncbi:hypothetical protein NHX12_021549 [Muraenolepis orangiensis]|uniref:Lipocalin/cytosolic fatty-acid binding domain-containing protein n=1 Tax=Muraenolepis orangiensis TaxID=630683 RepID=A0A9Q0EQC2_9TELE|nr:hypothetical protein NHX12_021549 [Muraenolepis orangiensis]
MSPCYVFLLALPLAAAQSMGWGHCPTPAVQANFSMEQFLGKWYEIQRQPSMHDMGRCSEANIVWHDDSDSTMQVTMAQIVDDEVKTMQGLLYEGTEEPAKMEFSYQTNSETLNTILPRCQWWVLQTDYSSMSVAYSCKEYMGMFHTEYTWIISRRRSLPSWQLSQAREVLRKAGTNAGIMSDQTDCGE